MLDHIPNIVRIFYAVKGFGDLPQDSRYDRNNLSFRVRKIMNEELRAEKERLGSLEIVDLSGLKFEKSYARLGEEVRTTVRSFVVDSLNETNLDELLTILEFTTDCFHILEEKATGDPLIDVALKDYLKALTVWSNTIDFSSVNHPLIQQTLETYNGDRERFNVIFALNLQNDNVGCISGMIRGENGQVVFWHNEEGVEALPGQRFDKVRLAKFGTEEEGKFSIVYPDLLPGAGYSFGHDFYFSVDAQHTVENPKAGILANTAAWIVFHLGNKTDPYDVIKALSPFADGYTINVVRKTPDGELEAKRIEFAADVVDQEHLSSSPRSSIVSTNVYSRDMKVVSQGVEGADFEAVEWNVNRQRATERALHLMTVFTGRETPTEHDIGRMLGFRTAGNYGSPDSAYANADVKSALVGIADPNGIKIKLAVGPVVKDESWVEFNFHN